MPVLQAATKALAVLDKKDIDEVKNLGKPPAAVRATMKACLLLINPNPKDKIKNEATMKMETDWWGAATTMLKGANFLSLLQEFDKENVEQKIIVNCEKFLNAEENVEMLEENAVAKASKACKCIIMWVNAITKFFWVNKQIKPLKAELASAEATVNDMQAKLAVKLAEL